MCIGTASVFTFFANVVSCLLTFIHYQTGTTMNSYLILSAILPDDDFLDEEPQVLSTTPPLHIPACTILPDSVLAALPTTVFHLNDDYVLTHVLPQSILPPPGLLISPEFAEFLQAYYLPPECSFHETTVEYEGEQHLAYWLHMSGFHTYLINFEQTRFARFQIQNQSRRDMFEGLGFEEFRTPDNSHQALDGREITVHNERELLAHLAELSLAANAESDATDTTIANNGTYPTDAILWDELSEAERDKALEEMALTNPDYTKAVIPTETHLDAVGRIIHTQKPVPYDLLAFPFPSPALFVSEFLAQALETFELSGHTIFPCSYQLYCT